MSKQRARKSFLIKNEISEDPHFFLARFLPNFPGIVFEIISHFWPFDSPVKSQSINERNLSSGSFCSDSFVDFLSFF